MLARSPPLAWVPYRASPVMPAKSWEFSNWLRCFPSQIQSPVHKLWLKCERDTSKQHTKPQAQQSMLGTAAIWAPKAHGISIVPNVMSHGAAHLWCLQMLIIFIFLSFFLPGRESQTRLGKAALLSVAKLLTRGAPLGLPPRPSSAIRCSGCHSGPGDLFQSVHQL